MSFDADLYRLLHRGTPGDVDFYRRQCRGARDVLELGCGDGRVLLAVARDGVEAVGLEAHPEMLAAARARAEAEGLPATFHAGDLRDFDLGRRFDRVLLPYCSLYCVDRAGQVDCLLAARRHLRPGGRIVFDGYLLPGEPEPGGDPPSWLTTLADGERVIEVFEQDHHDPDVNRCEVTYIHHFRGGEGAEEVRYTLTHVYLWPDEVEPLLAEVGLRLESIHGGFDGRPLDEDAEHMVVVAAHDLHR